MKEKKYPSSFSIFNCVMIRISGDIWIGKLQFNKQSYAWSYRKKKPGIPFQLFFILLSSLQLNMDCLKYRFRFGGRSVGVLFIIIKFIMFKTKRIHKELMFY